ncbi:hypothetical protein [Bacillus rhizoplanae]|uniref:hypothetical protein n=1 Tax=Bacillus rhizoplanae TaxID=2880966 RepID=UPI003D191EB6
MLSRTVLAFLEEEDLKNNSGMISYIDGNIDGVCTILSGKDYDSAGKRKELLDKWGRFSKRNR